MHLPRSSVSYMPPTPGNAHGLYIVHIQPTRCFVSYCSDPCRCRWCLYYVHWIGQLNSIKLLVIVRTRDVTETHSHLAQTHKYSLCTTHEISQSYITWYVHYVMIQSPKAVHWYNSGQYSKGVQFPTVLSFNFILVAVPVVVVLSPYDLWPPHNKVLLCKVNANRQ